MYFMHMWMPETKLNMTSHFFTLFHQNNHSQYQIQENTFYCKHQLTNNITVT